VIHTLSDAEVEQIKDVKRSIPGWRDPIDDLVWVDANGNTITWYGPNELTTTPVSPSPTGLPQPPPKSTGSSSTSTTTVTPVSRTKQPVGNPGQSTTSLSPSSTPSDSSSTRSKPESSDTSKSDQSSKKVMPAPKSWGDRLQDGLQGFNQKLTQINKKLDDGRNLAPDEQKLLDAVTKYQGKRIVINVEGENTYGLDVTTQNIQMTPAVTANNTDLYIKMHPNEITALLDSVKKYQASTRGMLDKGELGLDVAMIMTPKFRTDIKNLKMDDIKFGVDLLTTMM
jgi:hypothetical protein